MKTEITRYNEDGRFHANAELHGDTLQLQLPGGGYLHYLGRTRDQRRLFVLYSHIDEARQVPQVWALCVGEYQEDKQTYIPLANRPEGQFSFQMSPVRALSYDLPELIQGDNPYQKHVQGRFLIPVDTAQPVTITENGITEPLEDLVRH
jgi:hypothetical protein